MSLFLNSLDEIDKKEIKKELVGKYYAKIDNPNTQKARTNDEVAGQTYTMLERFAAIINSVK